NPDVSVTLAKIRSTKSDKICVVSDFDRTLTKAFIGGTDAPTGLSIFHNGDFLRPNYAQRAQALWEYYYPLEIQKTLDDTQRSIILQEWYEKHVSLFHEYSLSKSIIQQAARSEKIVLREQTKDFISYFQQRHIPFFVFSAGSGDVIKEVFAYHNINHESLLICSNYFSYNEDDIVTGFSSDIMHSYNKHKINLQTHGISHTDIDIQSLIVCGDSVKDPLMAEQFGAKTVLKIGFCHDITRLAEYRELYDVVVTGDGSFAEILSLLSLSV
ncbi:MAG: hypothetical protein ACMXYA_03210, partial [Candidatus Woesearchaeota archaeon]